MILTASSGEVIKIEELPGPRFRLVYIYYPDNLAFAHGPWQPGDWIECDEFSFKKNQPLTLKGNITCFPPEKIQYVRLDQNPDRRAVIVDYGVDK